MTTTPPSRSRRVSADDFIRSGRAAFYGSVFVQPDACSCSPTDQRSNDSALLSVDDGAGCRPRAGSDPDHGSCAARSGHPSLSVLVVHDAGAVEQSDSTVADPDAVLIASDQASVLISMLGKRRSGQRQHHQGKDEQETC